MAKCKNCGFVGTYSTAGVLCEMSSDMRESGYAPAGIQGESVICVAKACNLKQKLLDTKSSDRLKRILDDEFLCDSFVEWIPGMSPKDHMQMKMTELLQKQITIQNTEAAERQRAHEKIMTQLQVDAQRDAAKLTSDITWRVGWMTIFIAVVSAIGTLVSAFAPFLKPTN